VLAAIRRLIRAVKIVARDGRIPRPLRALVAFGLLPIPGPVDELALLVVGLLLWIFYRRTIAEAWSEAGESIPHSRYPARSGDDPSTEGFA
jgi:hypothetical protein